MELEEFNGGQLQEQSLNNDTVQERQMSVLTAAKIMEPYVFVSKKTLADPCLPRSFRQVCEDPE